MTEDYESRELIFKDRELRNSEYFDKMNNLRKLSLEELQLQFQENKNTVANLNITSSDELDLDSMSDIEKIDTTFRVVEFIKLSFEQIDLDRIIKEKL